MINEISAKKKRFVMISTIKKAKAVEVFEMRKPVASKSFKLMSFFSGFMFFKLSRILATKVDF